MILAVPLGFAIGVVVGSVGGGGAILALPVLVYVLDEGVGPATTAALIVVALGASAGAGVQASRGQLCVRIALSFSLPAAAGAYLGTLAAGSVDGRTQILLFVPVMLAAAVLTYMRGSAVDEGSDPSDECPESSFWIAGGAGLVVGVMTGFFGVGGGFLIVPALTVMLGLAMHRAIATSLAIITMIGLAALISHLAEGAEPNWPLTLVLCGSAVAGAVAGSSLGARLPARTLSHAFGVLVGVLAVFLLVDVLFLGGPPVGG